MKGQAVGIIAVFLLALIPFAGIATDLYVALKEKNWARNAASQAALVGASLGRDWAYYEREGRMRLRSDVACDEAISEAEALLSQRGYHFSCECWPADPNSRCLVAVLPEGGSIPNFPPKERARLVPSPGWQSEGPGVAVYLALPVRTSFLKLVRPIIEVHAFAVAGVE